MTLRRCSWLLVPVLGFLAVGCAVVEGDPDYYGSNARSGGSRNYADIRAAAAQDFPSDQSELLRKIAHRQNLSEDEQIYLIDTTFTSVAFSSYQGEILFALAENPTLKDAARRHLSEHIDLLAFPSDKRRVGDALVSNPGQRDHSGWPSPANDPEPVAAPGSGYDPLAPPPGDDEHVDNVLEDDDDAPEVDPY